MKDDLERAIHLAMERATIPINGSVGKTVVSKEVGKGGEEEDDDDDLKRAAAHGRKLALQNRDFRSVENDRNQGKRGESENVVSRARRRAQRERVGIRQR